jgi:hypothetical protein
VEIGEKGGKKQGKIGSPSGLEVRYRAQTFREVAPRV